MAAVKREHYVDEMESKPKRTRLEMESRHHICNHDSEIDQSKPLIDSCDRKLEATPTSISDQLLQLELAMCVELEALSPSHPVTHTYNPLSYAAETHACFVRSYGNSKKKVLFLGMNPGPFGMAQNGVPFGDTSKVSGWLKISGQVNKPTVEHPKRPILGMENQKNEVSGTRFWTLIEDLCSTPEVFFRNCYVHNYCPLCFMSVTGKNITPPMLKIGERRPLEEICDRSLLGVVKLLGVRHVIAVGKYPQARAEAVAKCVMGEGGEGVRVHWLLHPSPINPAANKDWSGQAVALLSKLGLLELIQGGRV